MGKMETPVLALPKVRSCSATLLWPTQVSVMRFAAVRDLNRELVALMESAGYWTSHYKPGGDLWRYEDDWPALATLRQMFTEAAARWLRQAGLPVRAIERQRAWTYRYAAGEYVDVHDHANVHLAAVYYIEVPAAVANAAKHSLRTPNEGGHLVFHDCRRGISDIVREFGQKPFHSIRPQEGMLVTFPGYLLHQVKPFLGPGMRTIASNNTWFAWD
jgi:hypothetical protein